MVVPTRVSLSAYAHIQQRRPRILLLAHPFPQTNKIIRGFWIQYRIAVRYFRGFCFCRYNLCTHSRRVKLGVGRLIRVGLAPLSSSSSSRRPACLMSQGCVRSSNLSFSTQTQPISHTIRLRAGLIRRSPVRPGTIQRSQVSTQHGSAAPASKGRPVTLRQSA